MTEVTWNAGAGKIPPATDVPHFETTAKGQAKRLRLYFAKIAATLRALAAWVDERQPSVDAVPGLQPQPAGGSC